MKVLNLTAVMALALLLISAAVLVIRQSAEAGVSTVDTVSIDMDPTGNQANGPLGSVQTCARIQEDGIQNYDEDSVDTVNLDITVEGVPPYVDNAPPGVDANDTGAMIGFSFGLSYPSSSVAVTAKQTTNQMINANPNSNAFDVGDSTPDTDGTFTPAVADIAPTPGSAESGDGVLARLSISSTPTPIPGVYALALVNPLINDVSNNLMTPGQLNGASIAVNTLCPGTTETPPPTFTPTPTPTPTPTATPTSTASGTPGPTATPTPIPSGTQTPTPGSPTPTPEPTETPIGGTPTPVTSIHGDVDCDGDIDSVDALAILRYVVGLPLPLPDGCPEIGSES